MAKKKTPQKTNKAIKSLELNEEQASQVKGGWYQALTKNEAVMAPRDVASGEATGITVKK